MINRRALIISILMFIVVLSLFLFSEFILYQRYLEAKTNRIAEKYFVIENELVDIIHDNFNILKGFTALLETTNELDEENAYEYLDTLIDFDNSYLRNIAILEDTTIIWNYPRELNKNSIGVDLAEIPDQRDIVLRVKTDGQIIFQGPVDLVQGDQGFIMRIPYNRENAYYGQISIVFNANKFYAYLDSLETLYDVNILVESNHTIIYQKNFVKHPRDYIQETNNILNWTISLQPSNGWHDSNAWFTLTPFILAIISVFTSYKIYNVLIDFEKNKQQALHDPLTGLNNRHYLYRYSDKIFNIAKINQTYIGAMLIDINNFKDINDTFGHNVGDQVLINFASKLKMSLRPGQEVFRLGGDEFLIIFENISNLDLLKSISLRLKSSLINYQIIEDYDISFGISIGIAIYPNDGHDLDSLYNKADQDMYKDKENK